MAVGLWPQCVVVVLFLPAVFLSIYPDHGPLGIPPSTYLPFHHECDYSEYLRERYISCVWASRFWQQSYSPFEEFDLGEHMTLEMCVHQCTNTYYVVAAISPVKCTCMNISGADERDLYDLGQKARYACYGPEAINCPGNPSQVCGAPDHFVAYCTSPDICMYILSHSSFRGKQNDSLFMDYCPNDCIWTCDRRYGVCNSSIPCSEGKKGPFCQSECPPQYSGVNCECREESCERQECDDDDEVSGNCTNICRVNWGGETCDECAPGWSGKCCDTQMDKCMNYDRHSEECRQCADGFFGPACEQPCGDNCRKCSSQEQCLTCNSGFYAPDAQTCDSFCPQFCRNRTCYFTNGTCPACVDGYHGVNCDTPCQNCDSRCEQSSGACLGECSAGWYGSHCENACPQHCKEGVCSMTQGTCLLGCEDGYYGPSCQDQCPNNCDICEQVDGACSDSCRDGWYGPECDKQCSHVCLQSVCDRDTGLCVNCSASLTREECDEIAINGTGSDTADTGSDPSSDSSESGQLLGSDTGSKLEDTNSMHVERVCEDIDVADLLFKLYICFGILAFNTLLILILTLVLCCCKLRPAEKSTDKVATNKVSAAYM